MSWINTQPNIDYFNITLTNIKTGQVKSVVKRDQTAYADRITITLTDLEDEADYILSVNIFFLDEPEPRAEDVMSRTGKNSDNDELPDSLDVFDGDHCAHTDTDNDSLPDDILTDCDTSLIEDTDDDNDGVNDLATDGITQLDACVRGDTGWISNATTDHDGDGCRDDSTEDADDDNDEVTDTADACVRGDTGWTSNATTDHDGDGCRDDSTEDPDDDNDNTEDLADAFGKDACASVDTDSDGLPDDILADCKTPLREDTDDDNDNIEDLADVFAMDACASADTDGDGLPDFLLADCRTPRTEDDDDDNDSIADSEDSDDDNDGLIEIRFLEGLANMRDDLNGDGADDGRIANVGPGNHIGCPASGCKGYELTRSLDFKKANSYQSAANLEVWITETGWSPIGSCLPASTDRCTAYNAIFDGNGHSINNLLINAESDTVGLGLFGSVSGSVRNLNLVSARVDGGGQRNTGILAGRAAGADILRVRAVDGSVSGAENVGGLVGYAARTHMVSSHAEYLFINGTDHIGGLAGVWKNGGMDASAALHNTISGDERLGGLSGLLDSATVLASYVLNTSLTGRQNGGGLTGFGVGTSVVASYAALSRREVSEVVGGLIGQSDRNTVVTHSYWDAEVLGLGLLSGIFPAAKRTAELLEKTGFNGIYAAWDNYWCDPNTGSFTNNPQDPLPRMRIWHGTLAVPRNIRP